MFRYLILDDDIRVEFGKAHEHARTIAAEVLVDITTLLTSMPSPSKFCTMNNIQLMFLFLIVIGFKENPTISCDIILTIAALTVRNEYCVVVEDAGGLEFIIDAMVSLNKCNVMGNITKKSILKKTYPDDMKLARESFKLLRALAGNDKVKSSIIQHDAAPIINDVLNKHKVILTTLIAKRTKIIILHRKMKLLQMWH